MDINSIINKLQNCPCGRKHSVEIKSVEIGKNVLKNCPSILKNADFPNNILLVADKNTLAASDGIVENLLGNGFDVKLKLYDNLTVPTTAEVEDIVSLSTSVCGVLSVGTGSLNDVCRRACLLTDKQFAIFATAPSMDGFASGTAPIIVNGIKETLPARQPSVIMADTRILANCPVVLKAAGFGDIIGKFIALVDWRVANLLVGEYYCDNIAGLVREAVRRMTEMADKVCLPDEDTAAFIMETLILTGIAMRLAECSRPASGAEHQISHFVGMKQLADGKISDFHGKKVGVATLELVRIYNKLAEFTPKFTPYRADIDLVIDAYGKRHAEFIIQANVPSIAQEVGVEKLKKYWKNIQSIIREELPTYTELLSIMQRACAATKFSDIGVDEHLRELSLKYHHFMRKKVVLTGILLLTNIDITRI